jgi:AAA family ATP:ADP antiporter
MPTRDATTASPVLAASVTATAMVAQYVIGKAMRDALFLSHYAVARLPFAMTAGALLSGAVAVLFARAIARHGPAVVAPRAFGLSALTMLLAWALALRFEDAAAVVVYLYTASFGGTVLSVFWSVVSESFDPHTARKVIGRIGGGATLGGVLGGALAWAASKVTPAPTMLLAMVALNAVCAWGVRELGRRTGSAPAPPAGEAPRASGFTALRDTPYLRLLALFVLTGALLQALLDYTLGAQAVTACGRGAPLLSFFAAFQTAVGVLSFLLQTTASRPALERLGIGGTLALLPASVAALGALALSLPSLASAAIQRGAEGVLGASLHRSAYEVLFTPVPAALKRPTKTVIDVVFDRVGLLLGIGFILVLLALWPHGGVRAVTMTSISVGAALLALAYLLRRGYVATLAERLRSGAVELDLDAIVDGTTRNTLSRTFSGMDRQTLLLRIEALRAAQAGQGEDMTTIRATLERDEASAPRLAPRLLDLLARDDLARDAMHTLASIAPRVVGMIADRVLDEKQPLRVRRRAARLLGREASPGAIDALVRGLDAEVLDVRHACGRALVGIHERDAGLTLDTAAMFERAKREFKTTPQDARGLEHAFDLLSLTAAGEAIQLAYGALQSPDAFLQGVALEYLDVVLPTDVRATLMPRLPSPSRPLTAPRPSARSLEDLMTSREAIRSHLDGLRRTRDPDADPSG